VSDLSYAQKSNNWIWRDDELKPHQIKKVITGCGVMTIFKPNRIKKVITGWRDDDFKIQSD
jgi:hypothetical protein